MAEYIIDTTLPTGGGTYQPYADLVGAVTLVGGDIVKWYAPEGNAHPPVTVDQAGDINNFIFHQPVGSDYLPALGQAIIDGGGAAFAVTQNASNVGFNPGFVVRNATNTGWYAAGFRSYIYGATVYNCGTYGIQGIRSLCDFSYNHIYNCTVWGMRNDNTIVMRGNVIHDCQRPLQTSTAKVINNFLYDFSVLGLSVTGGDVINNTVAYGSGSAIGINFSGAGELLYNKLVSLPTGIDLGGDFVFLGGNSFFNVSTKYDTGTTLAVQKSPDIDLTSDGFVDGAGRDLRNNGTDGFNLQEGPSGLVNNPYMVSGVPFEFVGGGGGAGSRSKFITPTGVRGGF